MAYCAHYRFIRSLTLVCVVHSGASLSLARAQAEGEKTASFAPPATPLVACDPYFSIWSAGPELAGVSTSHWTGKRQRLTSLLKVDGKAYRLMGSEPRGLPALPQTALRVLPTRTIYEFSGEGVKLTLTFMTPALPEDIDLLSRPITYISYAVEATDGKSHEAQIYFDASGELAVNESHEMVKWADESTDELATLKIGSEKQNVLGHRGDDIRIDWGYFYLATPTEFTAARELGMPRGRAGTRSRFLLGALEGSATLDEDSAMGGEIVAAVALKPLKVGEEPASQWLIVAYDDLYSIEYMQKPLRPYWRRDGLDAAGLLSEAVRHYDSIGTRCASFDDELMADLTAVGGEDYATLSALAYRQCLAAGKFAADDNGQPIQFCKENHSNGCVGTSDVFYPMAPQFLLFGPSLAKSFLVPFMNYAASPRWKFPYAPHDLGIYPKANGQAYGGGEYSEENQMPVEECGNLLILMAAVAKLEGNPDFANQYWPKLTQWAEYLKKEGFDPDNQLCTDDFAGHLAHNVNLSAKAICGLGSYALLCEMRGDVETANEYKKVAKEFAQQWIEAADDGDHFRLTFDGEGTWSQKYNLVWDKILGLDLFPDEVRRKEMDFYLKMQNEYGLPLDSRNVYTKLDWILWSATLTENGDDFQALVEPVVKFLRESPDAMPMTDWYRTHDASRVYFTARPVVGGVFLRMLYEDDLWNKWASRDATKASSYATAIDEPKVKMLVPSAKVEPAECRYTFERPANEWSSVEFEDGDWKNGKSGFGTPNVPNATIGVVWGTPEIWLRRRFDMPASDQRPYLYMHHDEDVEVYINGVLAAERQGFEMTYAIIHIRDEALATLKPTGNVMAIYCRQTRGGQYIDAGIVTIDATEQVSYKEPL